MVGHIYVRLDQLTPVFLPSASDLEAAVCLYIFNT